MPKARISTLNSQLQRPAPSTSGQPTPKRADLDANPKRGERGNFLKTTITIPADMLIALRHVGLKRRETGEKDTGVSELIREAVTDLLKREGIE